MVLMMDAAVRVDQGQKLEPKNESQCSSPSMLVVENRKERAQQKPYQKHGHSFGLIEGVHPHDGP
jgi:hypothetical protein